MKLILFSLLFLMSRLALAASVDQCITCIADNGLTLNIPDPSHFYMQPIQLSNGYDFNFLQNLIDRRNHPKPVDQDLELNIGFNDCTRVTDHEIHCKGQAFGNARYSFSDGQDYLSVDTSVAGNLNLDLTMDDLGKYQMNFSISNNKLPGAHQLNIQKTFGPKNDPSKTSLTPWSPGCSLP